ncbi:hypothetical protein [Cellvibrio sp. OA-2007]|uniref:hypothetical protein n=1 Tax=Cellvibrio sp. OA-2007 TaxID=529823 RepID=UPI00078202CC|nr:hypothetical protein [Cellvibrio sp. OA-2007]
MSLAKAVENLENLNTTELTELVSNSDICIYADNGNDRSKNLFNILQSLDNKSYPIRMDINASNYSGGSELRDIIDRKISSKKITICVDITYIERNEMATIFSIIADSIEGDFCIDVVIIYALAVYNPPTNNFTPNDRVSPAHPRFSGWYAKPQFPVTAIVGLGYEKDKAIGAIEYIEADNSYIFVPSSSEEKYIESVYEQNAVLLKGISEKNIIQYNVHDPVESIYMLNSIIAETKKVSKPALFPFGPKVFFSTSLIVALIHPEASVWYVSGEYYDNKYENQKTASLISYKLTLSNCE